MLIDRKYMALSQLEVSQQTLSFDQGIFHTYGTSDCLMKMNQSRTKGKGWSIANLLSPGVLGWIELCQYLRICLIIGQIELAVLGRW